MNKAKKLIEPRRSQGQSVRMSITMSCECDSRKSSVLTPRARFVNLIVLLLVNIALMFVFLTTDFLEDMVGCRKNPRAALARSNTTATMTFVNDLGESKTVIGDGEVFAISGSGFGAMKRGGENIDFDFTKTEALASLTGKSSTSGPPRSDDAEQLLQSQTGLLEAPTNDLVKILMKLKLLKMHRVTLKLKMNDTVPRMYMKAGVATYKDGKLTPTLIARGLSLEGFIFKSPNGTENGTVAENRSEMSSCMSVVIGPVLVFLVVLMVLLREMARLMHQMRHLAESAALTNDVDVETSDAEYKEKI